MKLHKGQSKDGFQEQLSVCSNKWGHRTSKMTFIEGEWTEK